MFLAGAAGPRWDCRDSGLRGGLMNLEERGMDQGTLRQRAYWENAVLLRRALCRHKSGWLGQDADPHPIYNHADTNIYLSGRDDRTVKADCGGWEQEKGGEAR